MTLDSGLSTVTTDSGLTVTSNNETEAAIRAIVSPDEPDPVSDAASTLGKKGAEARRAAPKPKKAAKPETEHVDTTATKEAEEETDDDEDAPEDETEAQRNHRKGKPRYDAQARINKINREKELALEEANEARREAAEARREAARIKAEREAASKPAPAVAEARGKNEPDPEEPKESDFESYEQYTDARLEHKAKKIAEKMLAEHTKKFEIEQKTKDMTETVGRHFEAFKAATDKAGGKEFMESLSEGVLGMKTSFQAIADGDIAEGGVTGAHVLMDEIFRAGDSAPALLRYFSEHEDVRQRISTLRSLPGIHRALGRIEGRLAAATPTATVSKPAVSQAKPPLRPVGGTPITGADDDENLSMKERSERFGKWLQGKGA